MLGIFLDQETTGLDCYRHKVLELACKVVDLTTGAVVAEYESIVFQPDEVWQARDSGAIQVNGFKKEDLLQGKPIEQIASEIIALFTKCNIQRSKAFFICANPSFDRPFFSQLIPAYTQEKLNWPYHWLDLASMYWALQMQKTYQLEKELPDSILLSKDNIAAAQQLPKEDKPHRAMQGVDHLLLCYRHTVGFLQPKVDF